jgi:hypothetical protein
MHTGRGAVRREASPIEGRRRRARAHWLGVALALSGLALVAAHGAQSSVAARGAGPAAQTDGIWRPALNTPWQWQLPPPVDESVDAVMFDIDMFSNEASVVASLHAKGRRVVCYVSVGSWEARRPDADQFPDSVKGNPYAGFPEERWLDIRRIDLIGPIVERRMDLCRAKGFDGIEPDNVDGYINDTGFPLSYQDQIRYNTFIAAAAHARGLSVGLKNDLDQVPDLVGVFDWALNEECFEQGDCEQLLPFIAAGKAVFNVEFRLEPSQFCPQANAMNFNSMRKNLSLDAFRIPCR